MYSDAEVRRGLRGFMNPIVRNDGQVAIVKWYDNKLVILISSVYGAEPRDHCKRWSKDEKRFIQIDRPIVANITMKRWVEWTCWIGLCPTTESKAEQRNGLSDWCFT